MDLTAVRNLVVQGESEHLECKRSSGQRFDVLELSVAC
jgi:hypothetical protein